MSAVIQEPRLYERLLALPENLVGEIINGKLYSQPRPAGPYFIHQTDIDGSVQGECFCRQSIDGRQIYAVASHSGRLWSVRGRNVADRGFPGRLRGVFRKT